MKLQHCVALGRRNYNICHAKSRAKGKFKFSVKITSNKEQFLECEKFRTTTLKNVSLGIGYPILIMYSKLTVLIFNMINKMIFKSYTTTYSYNHISNMISSRKQHLIFLWSQYNIALKSMGSGVSLPMLESNPTTY